RLALELGDADQVLEDDRLELPSGIAEHVKAKGARLESGLPHVNFVPEIPEAIKPRAIPIASSRSLPEPLTQFESGVSRERAFSFRADETSTVCGKALAPLAPSTIGL